MTASSTAIVTCGFRAHSMVFGYIAAVRPQVAILAIALKQFDRKRAHVGFAGVEQPHPALGLKRRAFVERGGAASPRFDGDERRISRSAPYAQVVKAVKRQPHAVAAQRAHADCLVTNDQNLLKHSPVAALSCTDALAYLQALE